MRKKTFKMIVLMVFLFTTPLFSNSSGFTKINEGNIHYNTFGSGKPFLIINGGPGLDSGGFTQLAELLSDRHQTILFDQRGTGKSIINKVDENSITMDLMVQDIEELREHLKIESWIILGHSFGGWLAEYYASKYPERVRGMILSSGGGIDLEILKHVGANINIRLGEEAKKSLKYWIDRIKNGDKSTNARYKKGELLAPAYLYNRKHVPQLAERLSKADLKINNLVFKDLKKIGFDCTKSLSGFTKPVLIIQGRQDIVDQTIALKVHSVLKNSKLVFLEKCGHYGWLDRKEEYKKEIDLLLASIEKK